MLKKSKLALAFMPFMLLSCGGNTITYNNEDHELLKLSTSKFFYGQLGGINFTLGNKLQFDYSIKSSYSVAATFTPTENNFGDNVTISNIEARSEDDWATSTSESKKTVIGFGCGVTFYTSAAIPESGAYIKGTLAGEFKKDGNTLAKFSATINLLN